jgi:protein-S-isoprenylcysteine O-methyltransferase Ste14
VSSSSGRSRLLSVLGWIAVVLFVAIYAVELLPRHGPPVTIVWIAKTFGQKGLIAVNVVIVLAFLALLPYRRPTKHIWKSQGTFVAFTIALMTEMFGWPLLIFLISPLVDIPVIGRKYLQFMGHWPATAGTWLSLAGVALIAGGWMQIQGARGLVTGGLYRYMRHPQYTGIFLFTLGWILHWPSLVTLALWPILVAAYAWLAKREEMEASREFGDAYAAYRARTKGFVPFVA